MDWLGTLKTIVPTVATALGGPLAGAAVSAIGSIFGISDATGEQISKVIADGRVTPEQLAELRKLEMQYQDMEKERGFKYAELTFKDRDSARNANVSGGTQKMLFWLSLVLLGLTLGSEITVLFKGYPPETPELIVGRVLGLMDAVAMMVLAYWYGTTNGSQQKNELLSAPKR
jgi:hypothetical protein